MARSLPIREANAHHWRRRIARDYTNPSTRRRCYFADTAARVNQRQSQTALNLCARSPIARLVRCSVRTSWGIVVAFALILRSLLAPGFMLEAGPQAGTFTVVLCSDHGSIVLDLDGDGRPVPSKQKQSNGSLSCPYAASAPLALLASPAIIIALSSTVSDDLPAAYSASRIARHGLPQPARGPPRA